MPSKDNLDHLFSSSFFIHISRSFELCYEKTPFEARLIHWRIYRHICSAGLTRCPELSKLAQKNYIQLPELFLLNPELANSCYLQLVSAILGLFPVEFWFKDWILWSKSHGRRLFSRSFVLPFSMGLVLKRICSLCGKFASPGENSSLYHQSLNYSLGKY